MQKEIKPSNVSKVLNIVFPSLKGAPIAQHFGNYQYFMIRHDSNWSPVKFQSDDVIIGSTEVK